MKILNIYKYVASLAVITMLITACEDDKVLPILSSDSSTFVAPSLMNDATKDPIELIPEDALEVFEEYEWTKANYGVQIPINYILEMDSSESFSKPVELFKTAGVSAEITVEDFNDAMLALGLPAFAESSVFIRAKAVVTGGEVDTVASSPITRTVTTYQLSDCGDFCTMGLIGSATPGGWDTDTDMRLNDPERIDRNTWTLTIYLIGGEKVKFRASDNWDDNWGGSNFPTGTGAKGGPDITVDASGYYKIVFNDKTGDYTFTLLPGTVFATIGVIGTATSGEWATDTDLTQDGTDPHIWSAEITLTDGEMKFRADNDWADNWGNSTYPSGYGIGNGPNIPVTAGTYFIWFNDVTGEYALMRPNDANPFTALGIIGTATPGVWDYDTDLVQNPTNPYRWSAVMTLSEGEAKFRADNDWVDNWGGTDLPKGIGAKNGPNFLVKEAKYVLQFHTGTGEYYFLK